MRYQDLSETDWRNLWLRQAQTGDVAELPPLASQDLQRKLHGITGVAAMTEALDFRSVVLGNIPTLPPAASLLDFGCGWGRHIRAFLKDFTSDRICGVDIDPHNLEICRRLLPDIGFIQSAEAQSLALPSASFDLIISFSVFSHINEHSAAFWLNEIARLLKPDGHAVVTSWGRALFAVADRIAAAGGRTNHAWERNISRAFPDLPTAKERYARGEFVFGRHGSTDAALDPDVYGLSLMSRKWIDRLGTVKVEKMIEDTKVVPQTTFFLTRVNN